MEWLVSVIIVVLIINGLLASAASDIADDKGYEKRTWFHMCFWLGPISYIIVAAMPDKKLRESLDAVRRHLTNESTTSVSDNDIQTKAINNPELSAGDYVAFGTYPQTQAGTDATPIEWQVLEREGNKALLISRYGLDVQPYNVHPDSTTWEECTLRTWLNETFMNNAFSNMEQEGIVLTNVNNSKSHGYSKWNTDGGNDTQDKIFILSYAEAHKYFDVTYLSTNNAKACAAPTEYAIVQGELVKKSL